MPAADGYLLEWSQASCGHAERTAMLENANTQSAAQNQSNEIGPNWKPPRGLIIAIGVVYGLWLCFMLAMVIMRLRYGA